MKSESSEISNCRSDGSVQEIKNSNGSDGPVQEIDAETKAALETELKSWSASSANGLKGAETERECKFSIFPDWNCIICKEPFKNYEVYQCQTGHLACHKCSQSGRKCRNCSKAVSWIRNRAVEDMMKSLVVTCRFANLGCKEVMKYNEMVWSKHEENCSFAPMVCPMPSCSQAGVKNLLDEHLLSKHKISFTVDVGPYSYSPSKEFELDSSTTLVMVRHVNEFHLLHQESTALGDKLQITSPAGSRKRKYQLDVTISEEQTYSLKSVSTCNIQQGGKLIIPKEPGDDTLKKRCKISFSLLSD